MNHEGIGLGLTIVKQIVQLNKGDIGVFSDGLNQGSTICFTMNMQSIGLVSLPINNLKISEESKDEE